MSDNFEQTFTKNDYYLGNQRLKRVNVPINYTPEQMKEFAKCAKNPIYFIKNYVKIVNVDKGLMLFSMWKFQEKMVKSLINNRFSIAKLSRQVGKSSVAVSVILWYVLFHEEYSVALLANRLTQAKELLGRLQISFEHLPSWLQQGIVEWNKTSVVLENGSKIVADSTSGNASRGKSFNLIYLDEFAFVPTHFQVDFYTSVYPTISSGQTTKIIITSTPNGMNMFYRLWTDAKNGKNSFVPFEAHWSMVPGRDEKWKEETIKNTSELQFRQEFGTDFLGSQNTLINSSKLEQMAMQMPLKMTEDWAVYEDPSLKENKKNVYVILTDTSRGIGGDYNAFVVFNVTELPYKIAARYKNNTISPLIFPNVIHQFARMYNDAYVGIEINDNGQQVADILFRELEYENVAMTHIKGRSGQVLSGGFTSRPTIGIRTSSALKRIGCTNFKTLVENDKLIINDEEIYNELITFIEVGDTYKAEEGYHDDLTMCCVLFSWMVQQPYFKEWTDINVREKLQQENFKMLEEDLLIFEINSGMDEINEEIQEMSESAFDKWMRS